MENETKSQIVKKITNYLEKENNRNNDLMFEKEKKGFNFGSKSSLKYKINKNNELIEMLNNYFDGCQIIDRIIDSGINENDNYNIIDIYIDILNNSLKTGKKILNFKYSYFFMRYNLDEYIEEIYRNFSDFIISTNKDISNVIIRLKNLKKNKGIKTTVNNNKNGRHNYIKVKLNNKEIEEIKNHFSKNNEKYDSYVISLFHSVLDILQKIDSNTIDDEMQMMFLLKQNVSEALYLISISDNDELLAKRNWLIGVYNSAYHNLSKKYDKMNSNDKNKKSIKFEKNHELSFNINNYTTENMIKQSNYYIEKYMLDNKGIFQNDYNQNKTKSIPYVIVNCISLMEDSMITSIYNKMVIEFYYNPNNYYPDKLQHNFVLAIFNLKKSRNEIKIEQELTPEIENAIIKQFGLDDKFMIVNDDLDVSDKKIL